MDPNMMGAGGPPMDPAMMGGMPPGDPMAGMPPTQDPAAGPPAMPTGQIVLTPDEFIMIIQSLSGKAGGKKGVGQSADAGGSVGGSAAPSSNGGGVEAKLDQLIAMLQGVTGGGAGAPPPPQPQPGAGM